MKRRIYQLGEVTTLSNELIFNILKDKELIKVHSMDDWKELYCRCCDIIRYDFNFNYYISIGIPKFNGEVIENVVAIIVFEYEIDIDNYNILPVNHDKELNKYYVEVED